VQGKRLDRVNQLLKEEVAEIVRRELKDPRIGFVTVTEVETSKDLRQAKVFISVLGSEPEWAQALAALEHAGGFIRGELVRRLRLRVIPHLAFRPDRSMAHAAHIMEILETLRASAPAPGSAE
jgi:ribosome-binding factor A